MRKPWLLLALIVAGLLAAMAATRWMTQPPSLRTVTAPGQFDALRAKDRLARVLGDQRPHPADSAASDLVRTRLVAELRAMGLQPRVDDRFACNGLFKQRGVSCARVRNVLVTIGPDSGAPHLLINSHYDSVPVGPGASDAGLGVAAMLEAASLMKDRPLRRPVTFLFNEGEELGLIGARAFVDADPLSRRVDALINLEARGTTGPVNMFETSQPNAAPVRLFRESVGRPVANSLAVSAYRLIPNYTDVNTFAEERRWLTLNFAPIGNETRYHSPGDDLAAMDPATLQHMGDQLLPLSTRLAAGPAPAQANGEWLFMTVPGLGLLTMPMWLGVAAAAGLLLVLGIAAVRRRPSGLRVLLAILGGTALAYLGLALVGALREGQFWRAQPQWSELAIYAGVIAAGLALLAVGRRADIARLRVGYWLLFLVLGALLSIAASGALIYFLLPPAIFALGLLVARWWKPAETVGALLAAAALFLTLGAMLGLLQDLLNGGPLWLFAPFGALILLPWLVEARPLLEALPRRRVLSVLAGFALLTWVPAAFAPAYSADRQQQWSLQYVVDPTLRQPQWSVVNDRKALPAGWQRFGDWRQGTLAGLDRRQRWIAPAPLVAGLVPARALPVEAAAVPGGRRVRLRLEPNGADAMLLVADEGAGVRGMGVPGQVRPIGPEGSGAYRLSCTGRSCAGQTVELLLGPAPVTLTVVGTRWSLPPAAAPLKAAQPRNARAQYVPDSTLLISRLRV